jgi:indole-3-glycerol phosphate synthase
MIAADLHVADLLGAVVAAAARSVQTRERAVPQQQLTERLRREPNGRAFLTALRASESPRVIAECKRRSPSRGILRPSYEPAAHAVSYARAGAAAISVLTEPTFFDGSLDHLIQVRQAVNLPLLCKDFIVTEYQVIEAAIAGADAVLLIAGALDDRTLGRLIRVASGLGLSQLVEVHDLVELRRAVDAGGAIIGVNSRNLRTLEVDLSVLDRLISEIPAGMTAVAESGIRTTADVERLASLGYHAFLVGEQLITQPDPGAALKALRGR